MTKSSIHNSNGDFREKVINTDKEVKIVANNKKRNEEHDKMTFVRGLLICRKYIEMGERLVQNENYNKIYKILYRIRKKMGFPGQTCDLIPREFRKSHKFIPECLFEPNTKEERMKEIERMNELLKDVQDLKSFENITSGQ